VIAELSPRQRELVRHALGLNKHRYAFRNFFVVPRMPDGRVRFSVATAGTDASDAAEWHAMVAIGAAVRSPYFYGRSMEAFHVTRDAAERVLEQGETLDGGDLPAWLR
jgi:hypothetical protein